MIITFSLFTLDYILLLSLLKLKLSLKPTMWSMDSKYFSQIDNYVRLCVSKKSYRRIHYIWMSEKLCPFFALLVKNQVVWFCNTFCIL